MNPALPKRFHLAAALAVCAAALLPLRGAETAPAALPALPPVPADAVRIADATRSGDEVLRRSALAFSLETGTPVTIDRLRADEALARLDAGKADLAVLPVGEFPPKSQLRNRFYAAEALICCIAPENPLAKLSREELRAIFLAEKPDWRRYNGDLPTIHRYALSPRAPAAGLAEYLLGVKAFAAQITRLGSTGEVLLLLAGDPAGIALVSWRPEFPASVKRIAVDGVYPHPTAIRAGSYPLSLRYLLVAAPKLSPAAEKLLGRLGAPDHDRGLLDAGWLPPVPRSR